MAAQALDRTSPQPLWQQLQHALVARLAAGEFADQFVGELALVNEYGVSRHTVRQALRQLRA
ncbi:MAG TPA: GntR family transcriptional regulator, partial [Pseudonocardiaceae bacterium]|nr:GntR family transcriptional regulator [Pseudonocardiaceae bacterium]